MQSRTLKSETADMYNSVSTLDKRLAASIGLTGGSPLGQGTNIPQRHKDVDDSENRNYVTTFGLETHLALANILTQITQGIPGETYSAFTSTVPPHIAVLDFENSCYDPFGILSKAFSPIDLEVTFTAAITLHMTTLLASSTKPCSFIDMAFSILKEMGQRGNIQASALADELSEIGNVLDNLSRSDKATIQIDTPLKVTDGLKLNDEILNILQMGQHKDSNDELQTREPPPGPAENATLVETAATVPTFDMLFDSTDTDWNFASEDLQWLDSVL
ncbi:hypothetical protein PRZ48_006525 [Zasmidium cellare]|uniref:Uncharacterized protein n=1 Tax=Zasmidium cellare TaxID=395010 RepID=A0ABR0EPS8_ZASCE|nr:hypothetical protein PRZ48_006525 [Zasmidium cellare]